MKATRVASGMVAGCAALLLACGGSDTKPAASAQVPGRAGGPAESSTVAAVPAVSVPRLRVLIIGTSLTAGLGLDPDSAYPAVLQRMADSAQYNVQIDAAGLSGETSAGALRRTEWLLQRPADVVVIETGANDGLRGLNVDSTRHNIVEIIKLVRAASPDVRVALAQMEAPPNLGATYTRSFHDVYLTVAAQEGVTLLPFFLDGVAGVPALNQSDGIHPNEQGARRAARNMWRSLAPLLRTVPGALRSRTE